MMVTKVLVMRMMMVTKMLAAEKDHLGLTDGLSDRLWELSHVGVLHILERGSKSQ